MARIREQGTGLSSYRRTEQARVVAPRMATPTPEGASTTEKLLGYVGQAASSVADDIKNEQLFAARQQRAKSLNQLETLYAQKPELAAMAPEQLEESGVLKGIYSDDHISGPIRRELRRDFNATAGEFVRRKNEEYTFGKKVDAYGAALHERTSLWDSMDPEAVASEISNTISVAGNDGIGREHIIGQLLKIQEGKVDEDARSTSIIKALRLMKDADGTPVADESLQNALTNLEVKTRERTALQKDIVQDEQYEHFNANIMAAPSFDEAWGQRMIEDEVFTAEQVQGFRGQWASYWKREAASVDLIEQYKAGEVMNVPNAGTEDIKHAEEKLYAQLRERHGDTPMADVLMFEFAHSNGRKWKHGSEKLEAGFNTLAMHQGTIDELDDQAKYALGMSEVIHSRGAHMALPDAMRSRVVEYNALRNSGISPLTAARLQHKAAIAPREERIKVWAAVDENLNSTIKNFIDDLEITADDFTPGEDADRVAWHGKFRADIQAVAQAYASTGEMDTKQALQVATAAIFKQYTKVGQTLVPLRDMQGKDKDALARNLEYIRNAVVKHQLDTGAGELEDDRGWFAKQFDKVFADEDEMVNEVYQVQVVYDTNGQFTLQNKLGAAIEETGLGRVTFSLDDLTNPDSDIGKKAFAAKAQAIIDKQADNKAKGSTSGISVDSPL